ncbi:MAG: SRPBCC domain-containing protein, partial [Chitinophagales bacterium]
LTFKSKIMAKTITQRVVFKNATTTDLYELYMNAKKHSEATGTVTKISEKVGAKYSAGDDYITGKNLVLLKNKMIVQTWKAADWDEQEQDSIFILTFEQSSKDAILNMVHANLPDKHADSIKKGWTTYYWNPWKAYLTGKPMVKIVM